VDEPPTSAPVLARTARASHTHRWFLRTLTIGVSELLQGLLGASREGFRASITQRSISDKREVHPFGRAFTAQLAFARSGC
jgi:hypothetical protein